MIDARKLVLGTARWSGASSVLAPWLSGVGAVLMLHRVNRGGGSPLDLNSHLTISPLFLDRLLADLKRRGFALVPLDELVEALASGRRRMVTITADDGWLDNFTEALPVLEAHDAPFTVYVAPALTEGSVLPWWEVVEELALRRDRLSLRMPDGALELDCSTPEAKRAAARRLLQYITAEVPEREQQAVLRRLGATDEGARRFMNWDEVRRLSAHPLATIGAHTVHHYNLRRLSAEDALQEMVESAAIIEARTGIRPHHFAYPYGYEAAVGQREVDLARHAGFASAVTTRHGVLHSGHAGHRHALPRISANGHFQRLDYMRTFLSGLTTPLANRGRRFVTL